MAADSPGSSVIRKDGTIKVAGLVYQCPLLKPYTDYFGKKVEIVHYRPPTNIKQEPGEIHIMLGDEKVIIIAYGDQRK